MCIRDSPCPVHLWFLFLTKIYNCSFFICVLLKLPLSVYVCMCCVSWIMTMTMMIILTLPRYSITCWWWWSCAAPLSVAHYRWWRWWWWWWWWRWWVQVDYQTDIGTTCEICLSLWIIKRTECPRVKISWIWFSSKIAGGIYVRYSFWHVKLCKFVCSVLF